MKKIIILAAIVLCAAIAIGGVVILGRNNASADMDYSITLIDELRTGKYYLSGGTEDQYIEVYSDGTICMYGFEGERSEVMELFENRNYYLISDTLRFIGLSEEPTDNIYEASVGYGYYNADVITFSDFGVEKQYIYDDSNE